MDASMIAVMACQLVALTCTNYIELFYAAPVSKDITTFHNNNSNNIKRSIQYVLLKLI